RLPPARRCVTMSWLLRLMLKEEFRVHASYSGQTMFVSFPFIITMFSLSIAVTSERLFAYTPLPDAILLLHVSVFLYGLSVGAFGFLGRQYLERTTGMRNYLVTMPGILPMRFRRTFLGMFLRDAIFYMVLLLVPATVGLVLSVPVTHFRLTSIGVLSGTAILSFLFGMSPSDLSLRRSAHATSCPDSSRDSAASRGIAPSSARNSWISNAAGPMRRCSSPS